MSSNSPRRTPQVMLTVLVLYFTFLGGTLVTDLNFWPRVFHHVLVTTILVVWLISLWRRGAQIPRTPLDIPIVLLAGVFLISTFFASDPRVSVEALWQVGVHIALYYILVDAVRLWRPRAVLGPIFFSSAVVIFVGAFEFASWYFGLGWLPIFKQGWPEIGGLTQPFPPMIYRLSFTLGVSTFLSAYLALLIPVGLAWSLASSNSDTRKGLWLWLVGAVVVQLLSFSRGGLLSLAVSLPVFVALYAWGTLSAGSKVTVFLRGTGRIIAVILAVVLAAGFVFILMAQQGSFGHSAGDLARRNLWDSAWQIGLNHPVIGVGPYGFGRALRPFRDQVVTGDHFTSPHNILLQLWAENGAIGVLALLVLFAASLRVAVKRWSASSGTDRIILSGTIAGLLGFTAHNLVDTFTSTPVLLPAIALVAYLVEPLPTASPAQSNPIRQLFQNAFALFAVLSAIGWAISDLAQYHFKRAIEFDNSEDVESAVIEMQLARELDPSMNFYDVQYAQYLGELAAAQPSVLDKAVASYESALNHERTYALNYANYAILLGEAGRTSEAAFQMQDALSWQITDPHYIFGYAVLSEEDGSTDAASDAYLESLKLQPGWVGSPFWAKSALRQKVLQDFLALFDVSGDSLDSLAAMPVQCWPVEESPDFLKSFEPPASWFALCDAYRQAWLFGDDRAAINSAAQALSIEPAVPAAYLIRSQAYLNLGDLAQAERDARIALFLQDTHAYAILGKLAERRGDRRAAEREYAEGTPQVYQLQGWDVSVYARRGDLSLLPQLDAPGPTRYDFAGWLTLADLYDSEGRDAEAAHVRHIIAQLDPFIDFARPPD